MTAIQNSINEAATEIVSQMGAQTVAEFKSHEWSDHVGNYLSDGWPDDPARVVEWP